MGIRQTDPRLKNMVDWLNKLSVNGNIDMLRLDLQTFRMIMSENIVLITAALHKTMIIPAFDTLCDQIETIYQECKVKSKAHVNFIFTSAKVLCYRQTLWAQWLLVLSERAIPTILEFLSAQLMGRGFQLVIPMYHSAYNQSGKEL